MPAPERASGLPGRSRKQGFSLMELLIVLALIIALAFIIFPLSRSMLEKSRTATSLGNLRQLSVAAHATADEQHDILPATTWNSETKGTTLVYWWTPLIDFLHPQTQGKINGLFRDPASPEGRRIDSGEFRNAKWAEISYIPWTDGSTDWNSQIRGIKRSRLNNASKQPYLSTVVMGTAIPAIMSEADFQTRVLPSGEWRRDAILVLYCDGRAEVVAKPVYRTITPFMPR